MWGITEELTATQNWTWKAAKGIPHQLVKNIWVFQHPVKNRFEPVRTGGRI